MRHRAQGAALLFTLLVTGAAQESRPAGAPAELVAALEKDALELARLQREQAQVEARDDERRQALAEAYADLHGRLQPALAAALKAHPEDTRLRRLHLPFALGAADWNGALADLDRLVAAAPGDLRAALLRARTLTRLDRYGDAAAELRRARRVGNDPGLEPELLLECLLHLRRWSGGLEEIAALRERKGDRTALAGFAAECHFHLGRWEQAATEAEAALAQARRELALAGSGSQADLEAQVEHFAGLARAARDYPGFYEEELALRQEEARRDDNPRVLLVTSRGTILVELFEESAPNTVASFLGLAGRRFYAGTRFHRVVPGYLVQGGDPNSRDADPDNDGLGGPGYRFADECRYPGARRHFPGSLAMANSGPDTNGSQFYLTLAAPWHLNGKHTVFGRVLEGMGVVEALERGDELREVKILRRRDHPYRVIPLAR